MMEMEKDITDQVQIQPLIRFGHTNWMDEMDMGSTKMGITGGM
jgi:hypothetical protein